MDIFRRVYEHIVRFFSAEEDSVAEGAEFYPNISHMIRLRGALDPRLEHAHMCLRAALYSLLEHHSEMLRLQPLIGFDMGAKKEFYTRLAAIFEIRRRLPEWMRTCKPPILQLSTYTGAVHESSLEKFTIPMDTVPGIWYVYGIPSLSRATLRWNFYVRACLYARLEHITEMKRLIPLLETVGKIHLSKFEEYEWRLRSVRSLEACIPVYISNCECLVPVGPAYFAAMEQVPDLPNINPWLLFVERENNSWLEMTDCDKDSIQGVLPTSIKHQ